MKIMEDLFPKKKLVPFFLIIKIFVYMSNRGCSSVVERMLCMYEAPGSIPGISNFLSPAVLNLNLDFKLKIKYPDVATFLMCLFYFKKYILCSWQLFFCVTDVLQILSVREDFTTVNISLYSSVAEHWSCKPGVESSILSGGIFVSL